MEERGRTGGQAPLPFGKYLLDAELAEGGMARVFEARLRGPGGFEKKLVVKQILPQLAQDPSFVTLFVQEANTLVQMSHPNVVPVYELGVVDGVYFLAMERVHGATVAELLQDGALPESLAVWLGTQVCEALRYAHERFGLVHRDVTPRNVIVDRDGHVRLLDFGIAAPSAQTGHGELFGSPGYMSPEQVARKPLTPRSDSYAVGAVLYEALSGRRAHPDEQSAPPPALGVGDGVSREIASLVARLLSEDPEQRPSAGDAAGALRTWLARAHPEGVQSALGARVERALSQAPRAANRQPSVSSAPDTAQRETRSIATSRTLVDMLAERTEALARPSRPQAQNETPVEARAARTRVLLLSALALLLLGIGAATAWPRDSTASAPRARPLSSTLTARVPRDPKPSLPSPASTPSTANPPAPIAEPKAPPSAEGGSGAPVQEAATSSLSVNATPWATIKLDGRALGTTPQRGLAVNAGTHVLALECPPLGRQARVPLRLAAGDHRHVLVDLQVDPPRVTLR